MDEATRREIERVAETTLQEAGLVEPPLSVDHLLEHVELYRDYYDLSNPGFLDRVKHKLQIQGRRLKDIVDKIRLQAVLLFDEGRICIDLDLPKVKRPWASCHEIGHRIMPWHKPFFYGDTAEMLEPDWQAELEQEANYAAARLLFLGDRFSRDARDVPPTVDGIKLLKHRYGTTWTTTLRRYVEQRPERAMAMLVSTAPWKDQPADQENRCRHFVTSVKCEHLFPCFSGEVLRQHVDAHVYPARGGPDLLGEFDFGLVDAAGGTHEMHAWTFYNQHYLLTLAVEESAVSSMVVVPR